MDFSGPTTLLLGFALGLKHATEADHVVAVSTLVGNVTLDETSGPRNAWVGASWGLGHMLTLFAAGSVLVMLRIPISPRVEWALELLVALVLIGLGLRTIFRCFIGRYHIHVHRHGAHTHAHLHLHARDSAEAAHESHSHSWGITARSVPHGGALLVGMAHGLAGTAGLTLLVLTTIPSRPLGVIYLLVFGLGALAGMALLATLLGMPLARAGGTRRNWLQAMRLAAGAASSILGAVLTYRAFLPASWPF